MYTYTVMEAVDDEAVDGEAVDDGAVDDGAVDDEANGIRDEVSTIKTGLCENTAVAKIIDDLLMKCINKYRVTRYDTRCN